MANPPWQQATLGAHEACLIVPLDSGYLELVGVYVAMVARRAGFHERDVARIRLAVDEACTNVLVHARPATLPAHFAVTCVQQEEALAIWVWDAGEPFSLENVPPPDLDAELEKRRVGGLGIYLMRKTMDEVRVEPAEGGKAVVLIKRRGVENGP